MVPFEFLAPHLKHVDVIFSFGIFGLLHWSGNRLLALVPSFMIGSLLGEVSEDCPDCFLSSRPDVIMCISMDPTQRSSRIPSNFLFAIL